MILCKKLEVVATDCCCQDSPIQKAVRAIVALQSPSRNKGKQSHTFYGVSFQPFELAESTA